jgi:hypothetical protein
MTTRIVMGKDLNSMPINIDVEMQFSDTNFSATLTPNTPLTTIVPPNMDIARFQFSKADDVMVGYGGAVYPISSDILLEDGTNLLLEDGSDLLLEGASNIAEMTANIDLNPKIRTVVAGQSLTFSSSEAAQILVAYYNREAIGKVGYW